eukprot:Amastigsp_a847754_15.p3 type:complete len:153 gc:universal Amastigsp_a847754_15:547-89(-)
MLLFCAVAHDTSLELLLERLSPHESACRCDARWKRRGLLLYVHERRGDGRVLLLPPCRQRCSPCGAPQGDRGRQSRLLVSALARAMVLVQSLRLRLAAHVLQSVRVLRTIEQRDVVVRQRHLPRAFQLRPVLPRLLPRLHHVRARLVGRWCP